MRTTYHLIGPTVQGEPNAEPFFASYGFAMVEWARVEDNIFSWFNKLSGMSWLMARAVCFSAKSFTPQVQMFVSAIAVAELDHDMRCLLQEIADKAINYYQFRNRLAHGVPRVNATDSENFVFEWHDASHGISDAPIAKQKIDICARNFGDLANITMAARLDAYNPEERKSPLELQRQVFLLPNPADRAEASQKQRGKLKQREQIPSKRLAVCSAGLSQELST